jgi:hypothetical protein
MVKTCCLLSIALFCAWIAGASDLNWAAGAEQDSGTAPAAKTADSDQPAAPKSAALTPADYVGPTTANTYTPLPDVDVEGTTFAKPPIHVQPISDDLRHTYRLNPFYKKNLAIDGIPIVASEKVSDYALLECAYTLDHMLEGSPQKVKDALVKNKVRVGIISVVEYTMDIPENQTPRNMNPSEAAFQDRRSRGLGGMPWATCAEENLLNLRHDHYTNENITIHEFSHTVASALRRVDKAWYEHLRDTYKQAMAEGLFAHSYSATNEQEYWAEGAQAWFDCASLYKDPTVHSGIWNRQQLKDYDPRLAAILQEVYGDGTWRYVKTTNQPVVVGDERYTRTPAELTHLDGIQRDKMPAFDFNNSPRIQAAKAAQLKQATPKSPDG